MGTDEKPKHRSGTRGTEAAKGFAGILDRHAVLCPIDHLLGSYLGAVGKGDRHPRLPINCAAVSGANQSGDATGKTILRTFGVSFSTFSGFLNSA